jgi:SagB-type dehydrogenase family enzyme
MATTGEEFYRLTKYSPERPTDYGPLPPAPLETVALPKPRGKGRTDLAELLASRRSRRRFTGEPIDIVELSFLAWAADGAASAKLATRYRTAPHAGHACPIETYAAVMRVEGVEKGVYHYNVEEHALELLRKGDYEEAAVKASAGQQWLRGSAVLFVWICEFARTTATYKDRGYRYVFIDAGHVCQNVYLAAESLGLGVTGIGALFDDEANALVGADGRERSILYMAAVGRPAPKPEGAAK